LRISGNIGIHIFLRREFSFQSRAGTIPYSPD
jgi:hypothetical protein